MKSIEIILRSLPSGTPPDATFFAAGDFNDWQAGDARFRFSLKKNGRWAVKIPAPMGRAEFKITRGDWQTVEKQAEGGELPNRFSDGSAVEIDVAAWADFPQIFDDEAEIVLLHPDFEIPQLARRRRIWALLPPGYRSQPTQLFPVIYMLDGQNLFDNPQAVFGSWGADKALSQLFLKENGTASFSRKTALPPIIIGIENGGAHRLDEYSPWRNDEENAGGDGQKKLDFICQNLKPFVDSSLRTLSGRGQTGIIGSSMGGLFAAFAALERPDVFGMAGVFSPAFWFARGEILNLAKKKKGIFSTKILLMAGQKESDSMVADLLDFYENLSEAEHADPDLHYDLHSDGQHSEHFWAREFEHALGWLLGGKDVVHFRGVSNEHIRFEQDMTTKQLSVIAAAQLEKPILEIHDYCHGRTFCHPLAAGQKTKVSYAEWENCLYSVRLRTAGDLVFSRRLFL